MQISAGGRSKVNSKKKRNEKKVKKKDVVSYTRGQRALI